MYLGWIDYGVLVLLLSKPNYRQVFSTQTTVYVIFLGLSAGIGIYQGCIGSKQLSAREFLVADGRMAVTQF
jgi:hypothetical protein